MADHGPFHRKQSPTQTYEDALRQRETGEMWGRAIRHGGLFPAVKAYLKPLCFGLPSGADCVEAHGVEFTTSLRPSVRMPTGLVLWQAEEMPSEALRRVDDETIALTVTISKIVYPETGKDTAE